MVRDVSDLGGPELCMRNISTIQDIHPSEVHVLAVDDSVVDRKAIERLLKTLAYKVTTVENAARALDILGVGESHTSLSVNAYQIDLIITDYCMPGMSGYDLLKRVKDISALKEIPVVIMSSENVPNRIKRCLAEGAEEFIIKPVQLSDIKRLKGHAWLGRQSLLSQSRTSCTNRKMDSEGLQAQKSERQPYLWCECSVNMVIAAPLASP